MWQAGDADPGLAAPKVGPLATGPHCLLWLGDAHFSVKQANGHFSPQTRPHSLPAMPRLAHPHAFPSLSQSPEQLHQQHWGHCADSSSLLQQGTHQPQVSDNPSSHPSQKLLLGLWMREVFLVPGCFHKCSGMLIAASVPPPVATIFSP